MRELILGFALVLLASQVQGVADRRLGSGGTNRGKNNLFLINLKFNYFI